MPIGATFHVGLLDPLPDKRFPKTTSTCLGQSLCRDAQNKGFLFLYPFFKRVSILGLLGFKATASNGNLAIRFVWIFPLRGAGSTGHHSADPSSRPTACAGAGVAPGLG